MKPRLLIAVTFAYLLTWIGGGSAHHREMSHLANRLYARAESTNRKLLELDRLNGDTTTPPIELRSGGPKVVVNWCIPLLPGMLITDSEYAVGPLYAKGSKKFVLFFGVGSITLWEADVWMA